MTSDERMATNMAIRAAIVAIEEIMGKNATKIVFDKANKNLLCFETRRIITSSRA